MKTNLELYKVFHEVAGTKSVTQAAENLFITQPAVSQAVRNLEEQLNTPLFVRRPRGMELTKEGENLFLYVQQAYNLIEKAEQQLLELHNLEAGEFIISAGDTICRHVLLQVIGRFHQEYPGIQVRVTNRTSAETINLIKRGKADLGILTMPVSDESLLTESVFTVHDTFVCNKEIWDQLEKPASFSSLSAQPLLLLEQGTITRKSQEQQFSHSGVHLIPEIELGSLDLLVDFAKIGMGIACVPREFFTTELESGTIHEIPLDVPFQPREFAAAWKKNLPLSKASTVFLEYLRELNEINES